MQTYAEEDDNEIELGGAGGLESEAAEGRRPHKATPKTTKDRNRWAYMPMMSAAIFLSI